MELQIPVNVDGWLRDPPQFGEMIVRRSADGVVTRLKDVARVEIEASKYSLRALLDNNDAVARDKDLDI